MNVSQLVQQQSGSRAVKDRASFHVAACMTAFSVIVSRMTAQPYLHVTIEANDEEVCVPLLVPERESFGRISQKIRTLTRGQLPLFIDTYILRCDAFVMLCEQGPSGKWYFSVKTPSAYSDEQSYIVKANFLSLLEQGLHNPLKPLNRILRDTPQTNNAFFRYLSTIN